MATKNFVPRATGEGQLGTSTKKWKDSHFSGTGSFGHIIVDGNITASGEIRADSFKSVDGGNTIDFNDSLDIAGDITASGVVSASSGAFTSINVDGGTIDGITSFTAGGDIDIGAHDLRAATLTADGLTSGRVVFAGTNGVLSDDSDLSFSGATLTATNLTTTGTIKNMSIVSGSSTSTGSFGTFSVGVSKPLNHGSILTDLSGDLNIRGGLLANYSDGSTNRGYVAIGLTASSFGQFSQNEGGMWNVQNGVLRFATNNTQALIIDTSQNLLPQANVSGSFTSTGSFGRLEATTIAGHSPITIDSEVTFNNSISGDVTMDDDLTVGGTITAQKFATELIVPLLNL